MTVNESDDIVAVPALEDPRYGPLVDSAVELLKAGRLVVIPTDTVYGIAADAFSASAVAGLLAAKGRGRDYPVPVLVANPGVLHGLTTVAPETAVKLSEKFWPGPLTIIVEHSASLAWDIGETAGTVGLRMPDSEIACDILRLTGPLAVSSANKHGQLPGETARAAAEQLGRSVSLYLESGPLGAGRPSTIVDCSVTPPRVVRQGEITLDQLREVDPTIA